LGIIASHQELGERRMAGAMPVRVANRVSLLQL